MNISVDKHIILGKDQRREVVMIKVDSNIIKVK